MILTVFLCCFDDADVEDGTVGFATVTLTLGVGIFSFFPSGSSENNFLTSLFCNKQLLLVMLQQPKQSNSSPVVTKASVLQEILGPAREAVRGLQ